MLATYAKVSVRLINCLVWIALFHQSEKLEGKFVPLHVFVQEEW